MLVNFTFSFSHELYVAYRTRRKWIKPPIFCQSQVKECESGMLTFVYSGSQFRAVVCEEHFHELFGQEIRCAEKMWIKFKYVCYLCLSKLTNDLKYDTSITLLHYFELVLVLLLVQVLLSYICIAIHTFIYFTSQVYNIHILNNILTISRQICVIVYCTNSI